MSACKRSFHSLFLSQASNAWSQGEASHPKTAGIKHARMLSSACPKLCQLWPQGPYTNTNVSKRLILWKSHPLPLLKKVWRWSDRLLLGKAQLQSTKERISQAISLDPKKSKMKGSALIADTHQQLIHAAAATIKQSAPWQHTNNIAFLQFNTLICAWGETCIQAYLQACFCRKPLKWV